MRLHGSILSMLGGTPAFNIGYENKSEGIYHNLGLGEYQIHYSISVDLILKQIDHFILNTNNISSNLKDLLTEQTGLTENTFTYIEKINEN